MQWATELEAHFSAKGVLRDGERVAVKGSPIHGTAVDRENRLIKGIVSTTDIDAEGEVVLAQAFDRSYFPDAIKTVYLDHKYVSLPGQGQAGAVGVCRRLTARGNGLYAATRITERAIGEDLLTAVEEGVIAGLSIGFAVIDVGSPTEAEKALYGPAKSICRKGRLLEYSFTANPCNPFAKIVGDEYKARLDDLVTKGRIHRASAVAFGLEEAARVVTATRGGGKRWRLTADGDLVVKEGA